MPNNQEKAQKLIPILIVALVVVLLLSLISNILNKAKEIQLQTTSTTARSRTELDETISFTFDKELKNAQVQIQPIHQFEQTIENNVLSITPKENWENYTDYQLIISVTAKNNTTLNFPFTFTAYDTLEDEDAAKDEELNQTLYPLMSKLPLDTEKYLMYYDDPMVLMVELKYNTTRQEVETEVLSWIREMGIDPSTHTIIFR